MDRTRALDIIRSHEVDLRAAGVERLCLFGSVARGEQNADSDVDVALEMHPAAKWTLFTLGRIQMDLSDWLGTEVDLSVMKWLQPAIREQVSQEAIDAF